MCKIMEDMRIESLKEVALRMLAAGKYALEEIASISGLSLDEVKKMKIWTCNRTFKEGRFGHFRRNKKLIDSILRGWKIPPIHVIHNNQSIDEVLDGQQRLAAIRDFYDNIICIDGKILPENSELIQLDGMHYRDLPKNGKGNLGNIVLLL